MTAQFSVITLSPAERILREFLLECAVHFPGLEIWITGGWVRDRLLGIPSSDLDLAMNNLTGRQFGHFLESFSARPDISAKYNQKAAESGLPPSQTLKLSIIERNADMSKQLETAHSKLFGLDIDLVNLRKEVYSGHSRTPEMEFGTPEEDALRRDATVNALFFHLQRQEVVDLTRRGLADLEARLIRTPLDPRQTFMDDPLRVLRLIRIAAKLNFTIDANTLYWMRQDEIRRALDTIVTRDRISMELLKVMKGQNPEVAFRYIFESNLFVPVFIRFSSPLLDTLKAVFPEESDSLWPRTWPRAYHLLAALLKDSGDLDTLLRSEENVENLWILAAYAPMAVLRQTMLKEAVADAASAIRTTAKTSKLLENALKNFDHIDRTVRVVAAETETARRSIVGMAIRSWGMTWASQVVYVMLAQAVDNQEVSADSDDSYVKKLKRRYSLFARFVWDSDLQAAHLQRPLLDGHQIQALFGMDGGGKYLKEVTEELMRWQFDHVDATVDEARAWLHARRSEFVGVT